ncbi:CII family transcriptional regulator [Bordetella hinzii]|uniref:CII family transcriptional regulator n=1 Tax=Bordetella hinzii TaxID=103855 RepID=UPI0039FDB1E7
MENPMEASRKYLSQIMQRVATRGQKSLADKLEVSEATMSRFITNDLERACQLIAALGLQVCAKDIVAISRDDIQALERMAYKYLQARIESDGGGY